MKSRIFRWHHAIGLLAGLAFALFPIFWMVSTSFKPTHEWAAAPPVWITSQATWANYTPILSVDFRRVGLTATALFIFILNWSVFLLAVVLTEKTVVTMPVNMFLYNGVFGIQAALATVAALPIVLVGLLIYKYLAGGFTLGAIKQ